MDLLKQNVSTLYGVGKIKAQAYNRLHIETIEDLLQHYPRSYENRGEVRLLRDAREDGKTAVILTIATEPRAVRLRRGLSFLKFKAYDDSGTCEITYFNQDYLKGTFPQGETFRFWGKVEKEGKHWVMSSPVAEVWNDEKALPALYPVYRLTEGLSQKQISTNIHQALDMIYDKIEDPLPEDIRTSFHLATYSFALRNIHEPEDYISLAAAKRRLIFDELFLFSLGSARSRQFLVRGYAPPCLVTGHKELISHLPYQLTTAQERTIQEIYKDMGRETPMSRIVVGDVGCGKTICAAAAMVAAVRSGRQAALMVPTEILARQHYADLSPLFTSMGISCQLLIGAMTPAQKRKVYEAMSSTEPEKRIDVVIGTQALLSHGVEFAKPGLVVTDEQHRFGVAQRATLSGKNQHDHMLVMSATPIPRTLALTLYGDLQISKIDEMPPGRQRVSTFIVNESYRDRLNAFISKQVQEGGQVYVVCPSVEESEVAPDEIGMEEIGIQKEEKPPLKAAVSYTEELKSKLPHLSISFVHGQMKSADKEKVMTDFASGKIQVLVSTTVIEVGVNVPNASLMVVENAERFGLSQLHQLRGRVGRGQRKSWCILVSDIPEGTSNAWKRLQTMHTTYDGYTIAEQDLAIRGPGDFLSIHDGAIRQSGGVDFKLADLCQDTDLLTSACAAAKTILDRDPELTASPLLADALRKMFADASGMMN